MFKSVIAALFLSAATAAAQDVSHVSTTIAQTGLAATADSLQGATTPDDQMALGAVLFLRGIETALQTRWRHSMTATGSFVPVLRLPVPPNPNPEPFAPGMVASLFTTLSTNLADARVALETITDTDQASLTLALDDLWFDIDMNGARGPREGMLQIAGASIGMRMPAVGTAPTVRFDTADAAWLAAYTHFLSAVGEVVLAFDPTEQIQRVQDASTAMAALGGGSNYGNAYDMQFGTEIDLAAMAYFSLQQQPDPAHTRAARAHLLGMIRQNRIFWARVDAETDNFAEWIPNARQTSALGITVPPETGATWQAVLADAEDLLEGRKLLPFWRMKTGAGINLKRLLDDPIPVDIVEWLHGIALLRYAENGERVSIENWRLFRSLVRGDAMLFAIWLN